MEDIWNLLKNERDKWQYATKTDVMNKLLLEASTSCLRDEKLVVVFGKPQVGKTTLILSLMGIEESKHKEIGEILRAGRSKGESSTSTAIIYQMASNNSMFGIAEHRISDSSPVEIDTCDKERFVSRLMEIREEIEKEARYDDKILYIYIPIEYFNKNVKKEHKNINILDVPGANSRDEKERIYSSRILKEYGLAASVNIIVKEANDISSLRTAAAPNGIDRIEKLPHKYFVVLTHAYSQESVRNKFSCMRSPEDYRRYMQEVYDAEFKKIFGEEIPRYFPVEVGESFEKLMEWHSDEGKVFLKQYRDSVLEEIRQSIQKMRGNGLKEWRKKMEKEADCYIEEHKRSIQKIIEEQNKELERCKRIKEESEEKQKKVNGEGEIEKIGQKIKRLEKIEGKLKDRKYVKDKERIVEDVKNNIRKKYDNALGNKTISRGKFKSKIAKKIKEIYVDTIKENSDDLRKNFTNSDMEELIIRFEEKAKDKGKMLSREFKGAVDNKVFDLNWSWSKLASKKLNNYLKQCNKDWEKEVKDYLEMVSKQKNTLKAQKSQRCFILSKEEEKIKECNKKINECERDISEKKREEANLDEQKKQNDNLFKNFDKFMEDNFKKQKNEIIHKINSPLSAADKVRHILLLGIIEQDYKKIRNNM